MGTIKTLIVNALLVIAILRVLKLNPVLVEYVPVLVLTTMLDTPATLVQPLPMTIPMVSVKPVHVQPQDPILPMQVLVLVPLVLVLAVQVTWVTNVTLVIPTTMTCLVFVQLVDAIPLVLMGWSVKTHLVNVLV